ncbi:potassium transporter Trk [Neisseria elongata subsp. glycolytica ATCC 29315]|uniref:Trk system potassium uptake protein n=1 Tax=Neisseria elongata subsp. glycolytica ATCC 29315 TaxID=546263 RepID=D4DNI7_NEIEG|nr:potassium transporter TrkG [Neisseria elongata]AJE18459.1 potassium transporter Trk [Neisseria elongata subsp. glycolytica ATCC 29315]EFE50463.1 potassium uptake protein, TrkH family [Neisseria elongata subsp. glycolytica ATCC 29315]SQH50321.1 bis(5'-nucleosyl)-tetraphosphatase [Neisseria elongata subsp. glycolytica]
MYKIAPIVHVLSKLAVLYAVLLLVPTLVSYLYHDSAFNAFAGTTLATLAGSTAVWAATRKHDRELRPRDGFTLVFLLWLGFAAISALPFYLYFPNIGYTDAFFEAVSGLTTTGATVMSSLDTLAPSLNFWRHMMNWLGGMGIIVLAVAILPMLGVGGTQLFKAEIPGIDKDSKMAPRISQTAKRLWLVYLTFTLLTCMGLKWAGMGWFDAVCHAMSAFSLGGFSTHDASIAFFDSPAIEAVLIAATLLGAVNFASHFAMAREKSPKPYWRDEEARAMLTILAASIAAASVYMWQQGYYTPLEALRYVGFNFVSIGLANGFANADFATWPLLVTLWMFFLSNVLANTGSMGGGIKMARALVLAKFSLREVSLLLHPNAVRTVKLNRRSISDRTAMAVMAFIFVYFMTVVIFTLGLLASGMDFITALSATIACITNAGPGLGAVGPADNYAALSGLQKWMCAAVMLLGRLEIFTVFILFTPDYWKK